MAKSKSSKSASGGKGYQSTSEKITALRAEIEKLEAEEKALLNPKQEYPKFIMDKQDPTRGRIVQTLEEEKSAGAGEVVPVSDEYTVSEELVEDVDAQAAGAHGPTRKVTTRLRTFSRALGTAETSKPKAADKGKAKAAKPAAKAADKPGLFSKAKTALGKK